MLCPECHHFNPDNNRFCGACGCALQQKPVTNYPREGYDEADLPSVSDADIEISQIDPRIPANEYAPPIDRSVHHADASPVLDRIEQEDRLAREEELEEEVASTYERPRSSTSIFDLEPRESEKPYFETNPHRVTPITYDIPPTAYESIPEDRPNSSLHGPSFLGLGEPDFLDEIDEPESHSRRNWLVLALIVVIGIAAVQWRNIRDTGMQYAGTMRFNLPKHKGDGQAQIAPDKVAPTASGETSAAGEGKPEMVVNPTNNTAQTQQPGNNQSSSETKPGETQQAANAEPNAAKDAASSNANGGAQGGAAMQGSAPKPADAKETASAKKPSDSEDSSDSASKDDEEASAEPPATAKPSRSTRAAKPAKPVEAEVSAAGADDLARAEKASDPATAANWLWAATKKGNTEAPVRLADYYANGRGVPKDCEQATVLLRSSARRGNPRARARLGMYYATGQCVAQDKMQAWHWLSLAHQADPGSDWIEQYRQRLWSQMSTDERARAGSDRTASE